MVSGIFIQLLFFSLFYIKNHEVFWLGKVVHEYQRNADLHFIKTRGQTMESNLLVRIPGTFRFTPK